MNRSNVKTLQVLVATVNQTDYSLLDKMNIQSDAIIANQCQEFSFKSFEYNGNSILWINTCEKGVGLNRNNAWLRATADIVLLADDDMVYIDNYKDIVIDYFNKYKKADLIAMNLIEENSKRKKINKVHYTKKIGYGAARCAIRREKAHKKGLAFNTCFGGGSEYSCGEDTLFLVDCITKKLKILAVPEEIAELTNFRDSSWFSGYSEKFFFDKAVLLSGCNLNIFRLAFVFFKNAYKFYKITDFSMTELLKIYFAGFKHYRSL